MIADFVFTATAVMLNRLLVSRSPGMSGYPLTDFWIFLSIILYIVTGAFWLPVVWMQMRLRDLSDAAALNGTALPLAYHRLFWCWLVFGFPAFAAVVAIFWLMIVRPASWLELLF